ncbi:ankyrin-3 [Nephila pilipes]|uniref:Ankyrin-3 n=1 Tax=Nephila pilipes TaxID=299642 RepID=A0A8X6M7G8_NEPPI|nr:ankyrin-3 [Nephila pilipes]
MVTEGKPAHQSDSNASFLRAARSGNVEKILEYLKGSIDINTSNANGLNALHLAAKEGHVAIVQELVKKGANVNAATKKGNTALHIASLAGQEEVAKILIRGGANPNVQSQNGFTPLYMAAQENHDNVVKFLLANGANQSLATEDGFTPLAVALQQGHDKVVAVLLENDAKGRVRLPALHIAAKKDDCKAAALLLQNDHDPDVTSKSGFTPLHIAAHYGNENIAALLLDKNADVNYSAKHQITPLHVAAKWGKSNMVTLLVDKGAKIDAATRDGLTPLHCAARSGHDQVVDLLLEKGAPITAKTKNGLAPLHMASQGDHVDSARILLYHKAPVDDVTVDYLTALHVAAHCGHVRVAKLLLDRKADPNARALNGFTPLHIACKKNRIKVVELLLKHGASIEATTESGLTPLHVASFMGCMNIVIYLIQHGANPDVPTVRGETPLHLAARANQSDIIRILLRNGAHVDASAREQQTPLHIAARLGNVDIVGLLLQHGAAVDATTKDMYTALHIAAKEGQEEVASVLLDHGASLTATTKKGFTPLHLAAKYGNIKVARLLLQKDAPVDAQGKNGVTPLHVAAHYDHVNVALLLLDKGAFPHATAKNGYTPLHIAAKKNQMDIATTLLEYGAKPSAESKAGFTPLHLAAQEGHTDMTTLLIEHHADVNSPAKNGLTPLHLCAQEDKVNVAAILVKNGAKIDPQTKAGYTPLHVACHFGQINMIRFLLQHGADVNATTSHGYTPLHQAAQQGHTLIINLLLEHKASPNTTTNQGQTALSIAQRLGYISVVETLKIVTETIVTTTTTTITEEKYKVVAPETMQETFMSDSEDEGGDDIEDTSLYGKPAHATHVYLPYIEGQKLLMTEDTMLGDQSLHYMTTDELKALADDNTLGIDVTRDERETGSTLIAPLTAEEDHLTPQHVAHQESTFSSSMAPDNVDLARAPVHAGFLVSFMVDARGGAMRGCRHSGVRVIIPPRKAPMPMRITCRYLRKEKLAYPPPLMEGEACASRILEVGPSGAKFLGPVIIEVPHFASLRGREREITILRSDNGESWREHSLEASDDAVHDVFNESFEGEELTAIEDLSTNRITRILTTDFPQYFAIITRIRQEVHAIGPEGGMVSSTVIPQVQAIFPEGALTKKIKVGLQAQPITPELVTKLLGNRVAVSPIVTVEPRRRKFHKPITLTIPVPQAATKGMINQYSGDAPTLRLLCSITGGTTKAQWEDVTGSTPLTFVNDCVSFTTTVSARFWLMDCRQVNEATKFATELYREAIHVPFMAKFVVFAKRRDPLEAQLRVFCMTDDKEDKTLESQEHFTEVAKSRDVEVLEGKLQYLEFAGNLVPVTKSGEQLSFTFQAFRENRLPFTIRVKDTHQEPMGRVAFMREPRVTRGEPPQSPICNLNIVLPEADLTPVSELVTLEKKYGFVQETSLAKPELIHRADLRLSDIAKELGNDWIALALQLDLPESDINSIRSENPNDTTQQALVMLRHWLHRSGSKATGNLLEKGLRKINREDIVNQCMFNVELVTDDVEKAVAKVHLDQSGFDTFKEELGSSRDASLRRDTSLNGTYDEQDIMKEAESAAETSSESSDKEAHYRSETRHSEKISKRSVENSHTVNKSFEEGPETLVQNIPTAMSESFTQNVSNGQISDASIHEDDKSELTVATLSSEATAEMEVSSLEDKSQTETHVEKKELCRLTGFQKYGPGSQPPHYIARRRTLNEMKLMRENKRNNVSDSYKRKVSFSTHSWTMTAPAPGRKKRVISRRNSWPPDSPRKLNPRRKYQQRFRHRDFPEPFWTNTFEWLTMQHSPEHIKSPPLAKLTEFVEHITVKNISPKTDYSYSSYIESSSKKENMNKKALCIKNPDVLGFYFIKSNKPCNDPKKYLMKLKKRCLNNSVQDINPTPFAHVLASENLLNSFIIEKSNVKGAQYPVTCSPQNTVFAGDDYIISDSYIAGDDDENIFGSSGPSVFRETYHQSNVHARSFRPLQSINMDSFGDVMVDTAVSNFDDLVFVKHKTPLTAVPWNKENIKTNKIGFPDAKFPDYGDQFKIPVLSPSSKKGLKISNSRKPFGNKFVSENGIYKLPKDIDNKTPDLNRAPQDMPDPNPSSTDKTTSSKRGNIDSSTPPQSSSTSSSSMHESATGSEPSASSDASSSGQGQSSKSYIRQLFEQDIQAKKTKNKDDEATNEEKSKKIELVEVKKLKDISDTSSSSSHSTIPADVIGFSFLKTLAERVEPEETTRDMTFPASAIGYAFLNSLVEQQNKVQDSASAEKSIPASVVGLSFLQSLVEEEKSTSREQPVPASVIGQSFLKNLISSQTEIPDAKNVSPTETKPLGTEQHKHLVPSSVVGQAFLKTLVDTSQNISKPEVIPSEVVGQTFLKSLMEGAESKQSDQSSSNVIPANVIGMTFMKNLLEQSTISSSDSQMSNPSSGQEASKGVIPAAVLGQSFLKTLMQEENLGEGEIKSKEEAIPAPVVGQAFLKTLLESQPKGSTKSEADIEKPIPSSVIGQTFMKSLIESNLTETQSPQTPSSPLDINPSLIPATVVGQAFLKSLVRETETPTRVSQPEKPQPIPAPVISQAFLKSIIDEQSKSQEVLTEKTVPASVVGQAFLKTLIDQEKSMESEASRSKAIPSSVVGQAFLKTLIDQGKPPEGETDSSKAIPSSVVGQAFLKTLIEQEKSTEKEASSSKSIPSSVVGQAFLKTLIEQEKSAENEASSSKTIPSSVVGQAFLKTLIEQEKSAENESSSSKVIPSPVVGQAFLKSLLEQPTSMFSSESKPTSIPSTVVGQTFLKMLVDQDSKPVFIQDSSVSGGDQISKIQEPTEKSIPASVVGQSFLKSLLQHEVPSSSEESTSKSIPSSVVGQAFLKTLLSDSPSESKANVERSVPAAVVGQAFLKTLLCQQEAEPLQRLEQPTAVESTVEKEKVIPSTVLGQTFLKTMLQQSASELQQSSHVPELPQTSSPIPASVIGSAFLKTLADQSSKTDDSNIHSQPQSNLLQKPLPANVIGQAFLKTLSMGVEPTTFKSDSPEVLETTTDCKTKEKDSANGHGFNSFQNGSAIDIASSSSSTQQSDFDSAALTVDESIIPPPPEFSGDERAETISSDIAEASTDVDVTSGIIGELLNYTKMMHSVIESMKDSNISQTDTTKKGSGD